MYLPLEHLHLHLRHVQELFLCHRFEREDDVITITHITWYDSLFNVTPRVWHVTVLQKLVVYNAVYFYTERSAWFWYLVNRIFKGLILDFDPKAHPELKNHPEIYTFYSLKFWAPLILGPFKFGTPYVRGSWWRKSTLSIWFFQILLTQLFFTHLRVAESENHSGFGWKSTSWPLQGFKNLKMLKSV